MIFWNFLILKKTVFTVFFYRPLFLILLKKYISLNGRIVGFNIDPKFNMCLDGLLILDLFDVPMSTIESLSKEINDDTILNRFSSDNLEV